MAKIIADVEDAITYINTLYESDSTPPAVGDEDYITWVSLINIAVDIWENEEGILWKELFVKLADAEDGDLETSGGVTSYECPSDFKFPASGYVWLGEGSQKTAYKVKRQEDAQLLENDLSNWCYFLLNPTPTLEFNPNLTLPDGQTISYNYYKHAKKLVGASDTFEMSDPMFAVYYVVSELKKDEGDTSALFVATQKLEGMKTKNEMPTWSQESNAFGPSNDGFGI
jgi:hypothetical protein